MEAVFFALGLLVLLLIVGLAFYWQGTIRLPGAAVAYGVEDSIKYITPRLGEDTRTKIGAKSVRRILEWEMKFIQDQLDADPEQPVVLGGSEAIDYVLEQTERQGYEYDRTTVVEVMGLQAKYMESIGALSRPVRDDERDAIGLEDV